MPTELSETGSTYLAKFVVPLVPWGLAGWGFANSTTSDIVPLAIFGILGCALFTLPGWPLRHVVATDDGLLVRNYRRSVLVPYAQIESVTERRYTNNRLVVVTVHPPVVWRRFKFVPRPAAMQVLGTHAPHAVGDRPSLPPARTLG